MRALALGSLWLGLVVTTVWACSSDADPALEPLPDATATSSGAPGSTSSGGTGNSSGAGSSSGGSSGTGTSSASSASSGGTTSSSSGELTSSSSSSSSSGSSSGGDDAAVPLGMRLESTAFGDGEKIPCTHVATYCGGLQQSPPLTWTAGPEGTLSYAIVMRDTTVANVHWVLYDIPANVLALPLDVPRATQTPVPPAGAKQSKPPAGFGTSDYGYFGPCPVEGEAQHTYTFTLYARPTASEAVVADPDAATLAALVTAGALAVSEMTGTQNAKRDLCTNGE